MLVGRLLIGVGVAALIVLVSTLGLLLLHAVQLVRGSDGAERRHLVQTNPLLMLVIVAVEELLFRSLLVGGLSDKIGVRSVVGISALVTFLLHVPNGPQSPLTFANTVLSRRRPCAPRSSGGELVP